MLWCRSWLYLNRSKVYRRLLGATDVDSTILRILGLRERPEASLGGEGAGECIDEFGGAENELPALHTLHTLQELQALQPLNTLNPT